MSAATAQEKASLASQSMHYVPPIRGHPIACNSFMSGLQADLSAAYHCVQPAFQPILPRCIPFAVVARSFEPPSF
jgi:hypothetical protein